MADHIYRALERRWHGGDAEALPALNRARARAGLPALRDKIVHFIRAHYHHRLDENDEIDRRVEQNNVYAACGGLTIWPRYPIERKVRYTPHKDRTTCKTCLRVINAKSFKATKAKLHLERAEQPKMGLCGGRFGRMTQEKDEVGCYGCRRMFKGEPRTRGHELNARGRRRLRRQDMFALKG
jgi:hypothetical protein